MIISTLSNGCYDFSNEMLGHMGGTEATDLIVKGMEGAIIENM